MIRILIDKFKRMLFVSAAVSFAAAAWSCQNIFEHDLTLAVNNDALKLEATEVTTRILVYSTGAWTVSLPEGVSWATLDRTGGNGDGEFLVTLSENPTIPRQAEILLECDGVTKTIKINQAGQYDEALLSINPATVENIKVRLSVELDFQSNMTDDFERVTWRVEYGDGGEGWISNVNLTPAKLSFELASNTTGSTRTATVWVETHDPVNDITYSAKVVVTQTTEGGSMSFTESSIEIDSYEKLYETGFTTNLGDVIEDITITADFNGAQAWLSNFTPSAGNFTFNATENTSGSERTATITLTYVDPDDPAATITATITVTQKVPDREFSFEELRGLITADEGTVLLEGNYISAIVIASGRDNYNAETNSFVENPTNNYRIDYTGNDKTAYIQSTGGTPLYGFRIKATSEDANVLEQGQELQISLNGLTLRKEKDPQRYTLEGFSAVNVIGTPAAGTPAVNEKTISELTDADVYTLVKIKDVEVALNKAPYASVADNYVANSVGFASSNNYSDCYPLTLRDIEGRLMKMLINMKLPWRRHDVPEGSGTVSGVLVHSKLTQYAPAGDIGAYQIRPRAESDIEMHPTDGFSSILVMWNFTDNAPTAVPPTNTSNGRVLTYSDGVQTQDNGAAYIAASTTSDYGRTAAFTHSVTRKSLTAGTIEEGYSQNHANAAYRWSKVWWNINTGTAEYFTFSFDTSDVPADKQLWMALSIGGGNQGNTSNQIPLNWDFSYSTDGGTTYTYMQTIQVRPIATTTLSNLYMLMPCGTIEYVVDLPKAINGYGTGTAIVKLAPAADRKYLSTSGAETVFTANSPALYIRFGYVAVKYNK